MFKYVNIKEIRTNIHKLHKKFCSIKYFLKVFTYIFFVFAGWVFFVVMICDDRRPVMLV